MVFTASDPLTPLETLLNQAVSDGAAQAAINVDSTRQVYTYRWANAAARTAQTGMRNGDTGYQLDTRIKWTYNGTVWQPHDTGWVTMTMATGGGTANAVNVPGNPISARRIGLPDSGMLSFRGRATPTTAGLMFTLPVDMRPDFLAGQDDPVIVDQGGAARVNIQRTGAVTILTAGAGGIGTLISLGSVSGIPTRSGA